MIEENSTHLRRLPLLRQCGVRQSFSASGRPHDNAVAETFFATFKKEEAYRREYTSEPSFCKSVEKYVQFYNGARPHRTLKHKTPQEYEDAYEESFQ
ncbi:integrase core domain-containing protein [uncultured Oscillibacter sp.]|uniref:integrase core domain-containing protein n=1 Tax=Oscillibacter sp. TaxID=1945593 RepID=UPI00341EC013